MLKYIVAELMQHGITSDDLKAARSVEWLADNQHFNDNLKMALGITGLVNELTAEGIIRSIALNAPIEERCGCTFFSIENVIGEVDIDSIIEALEQEETAGKITVTVSTADGVLIAKLIAKLADEEEELSRKTLTSTAREHRMNSKRLLKLSKLFVKA